MTDGVTGLVWRRALAASAVPFDQAEAECAKISGGERWRLPKRIELVTLLDYGRPTKPFIRSGVFTVQNVRVWTSSAALPFDPAAPRYWVVNFDTGAVEIEGAGPDIVAAVLCVKDR